VLRRVKPEKIYLFGVNPGMDEPGAFLKRLLGLLKYRLRSAQGHTSLSTLAAATSQRISTVKIGLEWLEVHGQIRVISTSEDEIKVGAGTKMNKISTSEVSNHLNTALNESAAFRHYYLNSDKDRLVTFE
jgi:hypothetical protein